MRIAFMGTPEVATSSLQALIKEFGVLAVVTQPDRPKGRGHKLAFSPVKEVAVEHNIEVLQPLKIRKDVEVIDKLKSLNLDFIVVVAFGQILPKEILDIPKYGCINLHASLLPKYRGAAPINWCIIDGEKETGITTMLMDEGLDTGDMLLKEVIKIHDDMTAGELHDIIKENGGDLLIKTLKGIVAKEITREKQDDSKSSYAKMLNKELAKIDWNNSAYKIKNLVRGLNPWPVTYTNYEDKVMKIYECDVVDKKHSEKPGTIISADKDGIIVACGENYLNIKKLQFPGGKALKAEEYLRGKTIDKNIILN